MDASARSRTVHTHELRVCSADADASGIVWCADGRQFLERARRLALTPATSRADRRPADGECRVLPNAPLEHIE